MRIRPHRNRQGTFPVAEHLPTTQAEDRRATTQAVDRPPTTQARDRQATIQAEDRQATTPAVATAMAVEVATAISAHPRFSNEPKRLQPRHAVPKFTACEGLAEHQAGSFAS
jgi:hypothetical protein